RTIARGDGIVGRASVRPHPARQSRAAAIGRHLARGGGAWVPRDHPARGRPQKPGEVVAPGARTRGAGMNADFIPISRPWMDEREAMAARRVILSGWVTQGPEVEAFEREFAAFVGAPHACAVSSGTTALHLALLAIGVSAGDEVVTGSHSFIATANAVRYCGATPVFVD